MSVTSQSRFSKSLRSSSSQPTSLKTKKLEIIGWKGPKIAMKAIKDSAKSFSKDVR